MGLPTCYCDVYGQKLRTSNSKDKGSHKKMRDLREDGVSPRPPRGQESIQQQCRESQSSLPRVSQEGSQKRRDGRKTDSSSGDVFGLRKNDPTEAEQGREGVWDGLLGGNGKTIINEAVGVQESDEGVSFLREDIHLQKGQRKNVQSVVREQTGMESSWWEVEPEIGRVVKKEESRVAKLKALGNAQVPLQAALAWTLLKGER